MIDASRIAGSSKTRDALNRREEDRRSCRLLYHGGEQCLDATVIQRGIAGVCDHPCLTGCFYRLDEPGRLDPIELWHGDIHDDHRGLHLVRGEESLEPVGRGSDDEPGAPQHLGDRLTSLSMAIDDEHCATAST